jgi:hypothetical protein
MSANDALLAKDALLSRAKERAEGSPLPDTWGYRVALEEGDFFYGRWRGETVDELNSDDNGKPRRIFLLWDEDEQLCFSRFYTALAREIDRAKPELGCSIAIYRGDDYVGQKGTGFTFGVVTEPSEKPLPGGEPAADDDVPF